MENDRKLLKSTTSTRNRISIQPHWYSYAVKRLMDIFAASLGLLLLAPFLVLIAARIKRDSPGSVLYRGPRMGKGGRVFHILKFRTMHAEADDQEGPSVTAEDDPRITPLGKWLRDTKLNELPQLWNVLIGEMSLVGPRPEDPEIARTWPADARREILSVRPGITSPASVAYHDEEGRLKAVNVMDDYMENILPDKLRLDQLYVRHHTFITDLDALFWTFVVLIPRMKKVKIPEGWLFGGPLTRFFRRYVSWMAIDFVTAFISIGLVGVLWRLGSPLDIGLWKALGIAVLLSFLFGFFAILLGLKAVEWSRAAAEDVLRLMISCALVTLTVVGLQFVFLSKPFLPLEFMFTTGLLVMVGFIAMRYRLRLVTGLASRWITFRNSGYGTGERVLIVGAGEGSEFAAWLLRRTDFRRLYTVIGIADDDPSKQGVRFDGLNVLGTAADIPGLVKRHDIGVLFYAIAKISPADSQRILATCRETGLHLVMISDMLRTLHVGLTKVLPRCEKICPYLIGFDSQAEAAYSELEKVNG
jgi:lipopolysaccharide/colanic/teichoic acid biosynthesis glycosyltransferase